MAYRPAFNPDALPAHAEPDQAAQLLGSGSGPGPGSGPPARPNSEPRRKPSPADNPLAARRPTPNSYARPPPPPKDTVPARAANRVNSNQDRIYTPPPQNYGFGPRPAAQTRPPVSSRPPHSAIPPGMPTSNDPNDLFPLFRAANASNSGSLTESELGSALVNGDYTSFDPRTVRMMINMFDKDQNGRISFDEFVALWRFLAAWRDLFDRFDQDRSGRISLPEFGNALVAFGYKLSQPFVGMIFSTYERKARSRAPLVPGQKGGLSFDLFVQACISLKRMTDVFKKYDDDRDGYVTLSFEEFLTEVLRLKE